MSKPVICKQCVYEKLEESGFPCRFCGYLVGAEKSQIGAFKKKQTNADRIRAMSDEELAECLNGMNACPIEGGLCLHQFDDVQCNQCILDWLKSEAKE